MKDMIESYNAAVQNKTSVAPVGLIARHSSAPFAPSWLERGEGLNPPLPGALQDMSPAAQGFFKSLEEVPAGDLLGVDLLGRDVNLRERVVRKGHVTLVLVASSSRALRLAQIYHEAYLKHFGNENAFSEGMSTATGTTDGAVFSSPSSSSISSSSTGVKTQSVIVNYTDGWLATKVFGSVFRSRLSTLVAPAHHAATVSLFVPSLSDVAARARAFAQANSKLAAHAVLVDDEGLVRWRFMSSVEPEYVNYKSLVNHYAF